jgi:chromosome partitioning protein
MLRIITLNPKGGSGKSTIATNLASYFAGRGKATSLLDCDPQGSSNFWLHQRPADAPSIESLADTPGYRRSTRTWMTTPSRGTEVQIIDTPARPDLLAMGDLLRRADHILIPVLPSEMDMHVAEGFITDLLRSVRLRDPGQVVGTCANRVHADCPIARQLDAFLARQPVPHIATFRDSANYLRACSRGLGLFEMAGAEEDTLQWRPLLQYIDPQAGQTIAPAAPPRRQPETRVRRRSSRGAGYRLGQARHAI